MVHQVFLQYNTVRACCLLSRNWLTLSQLCGVDKKQFCSDTSDSHSGQNNENLLSFKEKMIRKHHWPQEEHARFLQQKFPEPKKVVDDLFAPFENVEESLIPNIEKTHKLGNRICVTKLNLKWPKSVNIVGKHEDENMSTEYAYLNTCDFLTKIGLVKIPRSNEEFTTKPYDADNVIKVLEELASMQTAIAGFETSNFRVLNLLQNDIEDDDIFWSSSIRVAWPVSFTVNSKSTCLSLAYYQSCLKAIMKLKGLGYLDQIKALKALKYSLLSLTEA